jgi:imidazole glycerol phosphate synthase subunit HisF
MDTISTSRIGCPEAVNIPVIASGGAGNLQHLYEGLTEGLRKRCARGIDISFPGSDDR